MKKQYQQSQQSVYQQQPMYQQPQQQPKMKKIKKNNTGWGVVILTICSIFGSMCIVFGHMF